MKTKIFAALTTIAAIAAFSIPVKAQTLSKPNSKGGNYTVTGNSLGGINNRTAQQDYSRFFNNQNSQNTRGNLEQTIPSGQVWQIGEQVEVRRDEPVTSPNTVIFPQPNQYFNNGNDAVQVQLDIGTGETR